MISGVSIALQSGGMAADTSVSVLRWQLGKWTVAGFGVVLKLKAHFTLLVYLRLGPGWHRVQHKCLVSFRSMRL